MNKNILFLVSILALNLYTSCKKKDVSPGPQIKFIFQFDSSQTRLNNLGEPSTLPAGHKAQSPRFNTMSAHYIEITPDEFTPLGGGSVLYKAPETTLGGNNAIDFNNSNFAGDGESFLNVPLKSIAQGNYNWLRVSLAYQNYNVYVKAAGYTFDAAVASFIGFRTYVKSFKVKDSIVNINANKEQGFWAFEASIPGFGFVQTGQAPKGATTVPNPLFSTSPIPAGSCVVTGRFASPLKITGNETSDIIIHVSLSTNKSFEWIDNDGNNSYDPLNGDNVADMGIRGLVPVKQ